MEATKLWLLVEWDPRKAEWLARQGVYVPPPGADPEEYLGLDYSDWYYVELLILRRPVFVNATLFPRVVVEEEPRVVEASAVRWPGERLSYSFSWGLANGTVVSRIAAGGRILEFGHLLARREYALVRIMQRPGQLVISASYRPPYNLTLWIAGRRYSWSSEGYDLEVIRGMDAMRYPVVATEYWDTEIPFGQSGLLYTLGDITGEMKQRGYGWFLVLYRVWGRNQTAFYANHARSVPNSWGNIFFFRDYDLFARAQEWCAAVLPRTYFKPAPAGPAPKADPEGVADVPGVDPVPGANTSPGAGIRLILQKDPMANQNGTI